MLESGLSGSMRGVPSNGHPYRDPGSFTALWASFHGPSGFGCSIKLASASARPISHSTKPATGCRSSAARRESGFRIPIGKLFWLHRLRASQHREYLLPDLQSGGPRHGPACQFSALKSEEARCNSMDRGCKRIDAIPASAACSAAPKPSFCKSASAASCNSRAAPSTP
jgi:hypothetical protein